jgi:hypothetical protein
MITKLLLCLKENDSVTIKRDMTGDIIITMTTNDSTQSEIIMEKNLTMNKTAFTRIEAELLKVFEHYFYIRNDAPALPRRRIK